MRKSRFTEAQITRIVTEQEAGMATARVYRRHGLSHATFYKLKGLCGGRDVSEAKRERQLQHENTKLKRLLADAILDNIVHKKLPERADEADGAPCDEVSRDPATPGLCLGRY